MELIYRFAKKKDINDLARIHYSSVKSDENNFEYRMGLSYLKAYYKLFIEEKYSVIICAEDVENKRILGFASGTLNYKYHFQYIKENRLKLFFSILIKILFDVSVIKMIFSRIRNRDEYDVNNPPVGHFTHWVWDNAEFYPGGSLILLKKWLSIMKLFTERVRFEVNQDNIQVVNIHKLLGAQLINEIDTNDRGVRLIMEYIFN